MGACMLLSLIMPAMLALVQIWWFGMFFPSAPWIAAIIPLSYIAITLPMAVNLFFKRNWLSRLVRWLSPDGKTLEPWRIVIDCGKNDQSPAPTYPEPVQVAQPPIQGESTRHPDERYMPPKYRG
jgi:hypothetical protein